MITESWRFIRKYGFFVLGGILLVEAFYLVRMGYFGAIVAFLLTAYSAVLVCALLAVVGVLTLAKQRGWASRVLGVSLLVIGFALAQVVSAITLGTFAADSPTQLKANCEKLVPALDAYYQSNGTYPAHLAELETLPDKVDSSICEYGQKRDGYSFSLSKAFLGHYFYSSDTGEWLLVD